MIDNRDNSGSKNPNWRGGKISKKCEVCNTLFCVFPSQKHIKCCNVKCSNKLKSINNKCWNRGITKDIDDRMMKISDLKTGVPRTKEHRKNISVGTKREMHKPEKWKSFLKKNKERDTSFMQTKEWVEKMLRIKKSKKYIYKNICMRSNWEILYAGWLDSKKLHWEYEPLITRLKEINMCYCPDFYVKEWKKFVEVKGYLSEDGKKKIEAFKEKFGDKKLIVVDEKEMKRLGLI